MRCAVDYGEGRMDFEVPDWLATTVLEGSEPPALADPAAALREQLAEPIGSPALAELCRGRRSAAIVISDHTRPRYASPILEELVAELERCGIASRHITTVIATGLHRAPTEDEIRKLLGGDLHGRINFIAHDARAADTHGEAGVMSDGQPLMVNKTFLAADLKIIVGLVEPHFMAGYSGGRKMVLPGIASRENIFALHSFGILHHSRARAGVLQRNPVHETALDAARLAGVDFSINVTIDRRHRPTGIFAGELERAHGAAVKFGEQYWRCRAQAKADVVVTSGGGAPLDATFYQAIKGAVTAADVLKRGGTIILASECAEGLGSDEFAAEIGNFKNARDYLNLLDRRGETVVDQWQLQKLAAVMTASEVTLVSSLGETTEAPVQTAPTIEEALGTVLAEKPNVSSVCVIPTGPYVIAEADA